MSRTVKFTVSIPEPVFKELEASRRRARMSRSQLVREAVQGLGSRADKRTFGRTVAGAAVREGPARYEIPAPSLQEITDAGERRRRAIAAAGRFRSGAPDLSKDQDKYLEDSYAAVSGTGSSSATGSGRKP